VVGGRAVFFLFFFFFFGRIELRPSPQHGDHDRNIYCGADWAEEVLRGHDRNWHGAGAAEAAVVV